MHLEPKKYILIVVAFWVVSITASLSWNLFQLEQSVERDHVRTAKAFFQQILITRGWSASHGGLYLHVTEKLPPNPYIHLPNRDIETTEGEHLTLINPALMTRMISEVAREQGEIHFHLTSLQLINPGNKPFPWEKTALLNFGKSQSGEFFFYQKEGDERIFNYISPLYVTEECLQCHKQQGYHKGDVRGGLSISFPVNKRKVNVLLFSHFLILCFGVLLIAGFGNRIVRLTDTLREQSKTDSLTQVANRSSLDTTLHREWLRSQRAGTPSSLIMCDIDHFKLYNDTYGHQAGDRCLQQVAQALCNTINRPADFVARYGGEEFIVILPDVTVEGARDIAELLRAAVETLQITHNASKKYGVITVSLGVVTSSSQNSDAKELIDQADKALYRSKANGRNKITHAIDLC